MRADPDFHGTEYSHAFMQHKDNWHQAEEQTAEVAEKLTEYKVPQVVDAADQGTLLLGPVPDWHDPALLYCGNIDELVVFCHQHKAVPGLRTAQVRAFNSSANTLACFRVRRSAA